MYILQIDDHLKFLTGKNVKDYVGINFSEYFKSTREKLYSKISEEQNLRKVVESLYIFLKTPDTVEQYVEMIQSNLLINMYIAIILRF